MTPPPRPRVRAHRRGRGAGTTATASATAPATSSQQIGRAGVEELVDLVAAVEGGRRVGGPAVVDDHALPEVAERAPVRDRAALPRRQRACDRRREPLSPPGRAEQNDEHDGSDEDGGQLDADRGDRRRACERCEHRLASAAAGGEGSQPGRDERDPEARQVGPHARRVLGHGRGDRKERRGDQGR